MAFCTKCGTQLAGDANFCAKCGTPCAPSTPSADSTIDDVLKELYELVGLKSAKEALRKIASQIEISGKHFMFTGNPGTGKTAVARIMGNMFKALGVLPTNNVVEADRSKLVAAYVGQTCMQVNKICDSAMGGILFIDEAYDLLQGKSDMFGQEAVDTLLKRMEDDRGKFMVIMSGYAKEMEAFLQLNPGLKSRFTDYIAFDDFNAAEMREIFAGMAKNKKIEFGPGFDDALQKKLADIYGARDASFANARTVRMLFDKTHEKVAARVMGNSESLIMRVEDL